MRQVQHERVIGCQEVEAPGSHVRDVAGLVKLPATPPLIKRRHGGLVRDRVRLTGVRVVKLVVAGRVQRFERVVAVVRLGPLHFVCICQHLSRSLKSQS